jgi:hypothetical protein
MRIKTRWHRQRKPRSDAELASVAAATIWRVGHQALKNLRVADFAIEAGPRYMQVMNELLAYLVQAADRIAYQRLEAQRRVDFTTALARRLSEIMENNLRELLGEADAPYRKGFIELINRRAGEYAAFDFADGAPDYGFRRHLATCLSESMEERDRTWIHDQVMEIEAPESWCNVMRALDQILPPAAQPSTDQPGAGLDPP